MTRRRRLLFRVECPAFAECFTCIEQRRWSGDANVDFIDWVPEVLGLSLIKPAEHYVTG